MDKKLGRLLRPSVGVYLLVLAVFAVATLLTGNYILAGIEGLAALALLIFFLQYQKYRKKAIKRYVRSIESDVPESKGAKSPFPTVALRIADGVIVCTNRAFADVAGYRDGFSDKPIQQFIPGLSLDWLAAGKKEYPYDVTLGKRRYRVHGTSVRADDSEETLLGLLYFSDLTELYQVRDEYIRSRPVVSIILIDNYEEMTKNLTESAISNLDAKINEAINNWCQGFRGLLRKMEKNRYLFIFEKRDLSIAAEEKFSLLEDVHQIMNPSGMEASISFGLGVDGTNFEECYNFAALSIEMALSRGGDQAVVKDRYNFTFYGGRTKEADHRSKVRSRVTANSMMELIGQSSQVFIMGHRNADLDALGAAMGVSCMCRKKGKKAYIVMDVEHNSVDKLLPEILAVPEYSSTFISGQEALLLCDNHSTLVVVDTNRPDQVESRNLLEAIPKICVVDHHRRAADYISPVVVNLHEPYASSAAELVTELLQYSVDKTDVLPIEAKSLMAGIFMDTKSFNVRTGERTFEAAAYLKKLGADTVEVKKLLQNDFQDTMAKYQIIKSARLYRQELAIAALDTTTTRVLAAQAADELLNISGITASFVLYPDGQRVIVSGRSIGEANVQMILESLGGGGNAATAGAQVKNATVKEVLDQLVASIDRYYET